TGTLWRRPIHKRRPRKPRHIADEQRVGIAHVKLALLHECELAGEFSFMPNVVSVEQCDQLAASDSQCRVASSGDALILLADVMDLVAVWFEYVFELRRVSRSIVNDEHFVTLEVLNKNGAQRFTDVRRDVVSRNDDADQRQLRTVMISVLQHAGPRNKSGAGRPRNRRCNRCTTGTRQRRRSSTPCRR